ncbi:Arp2/3 complex 16 kDa subunit ARPC5 [Tothia fuscella]|uniref:Actin-related protein 2/3 complex subunit 5 n=1 Tax=Tothia fuscella TaxID=1048955 RepID=A0A9P4NWZ3_9PEZI|nr:Arp2/3 complex 16 kDa subunit ARPC5 [Tothia fuscella]
MSLVNWRTINVDALDPESAANFDLTSLTPALAPVSLSDVQQLSTQVRQLLRGGDAEGALRGALENAPYGGDERGKEAHLATVIEVLQSIRQSEMSPILSRIYQSEGGSEVLDTLMKYLMDCHRYKGMSQGAHGSSGKSMSPTPTGFSQAQSRNVGSDTGGQGMSVLLSWHEKLVETAGPGSIVRVMTDRRTV